MFPEGLGGTDKPWGAVVALYQRIEEAKGILPEPGQVTGGGLE